jgi:hypothetical protein
MPVIPARIAGIQKPWMAEFQILMFWMPPVHGGMTGVIFLQDFNFSK